MNVKSASRSRLGEPMIALIIVLVVAFVAGGASRADVIGQSIVRATAIAIGAWCLVRANPPVNASVKVPLILMIGWLVLIGIQLIPLPPETWSDLPARDRFAAILAQVGVEEAWRPLTLAPAATRNAFFAALVPLAVLLAAGRIEGDGWRTVLYVLLALASLSALFGVLQITSQARWTYIYRVTNEGAGVGLFANRNHQAFLLAATFPLLACFAALPRKAEETQGFARILATGGAALLIPLILITGSRTGLVLMVVGALGGFLVYSAATPSGQARPSARPRRGRRSPAPAIKRAVIIGGLVALVAATVLMARAEALQRLFSQDVSQEVRLRLFGTILDIGLRYLPFGTGFGSFDPVFRMHEPMSNLSPTYLNHAHNDLLEIVIEGGLPAILLLGAFVAWAAWRSWSVWMRRKTGARSVLLVSQTGSVVILILLLGSLSDYPLRTPALAALFAVATAMLAQRASPRRSE